MPHFAVILPAAGRSVRFGSDKLRAELNGQRVIDRTVEAFSMRDDVSQIVVVGIDDGFQLAHEKVTRCSGGANRAESVKHGLTCVDPTIEWVAIHDAARPLVSQELIDRTLRAALKHGAAAPALPVALTIKRAAKIDGDSDSMRVEQTIPRQNLWALQTPQIARRAELIAAIEHCPIPLDQLTDDLQALELIGKPTVLVLGEERNLKITTPIDLSLAGLLDR
ncbi:MAG TPA: 2-C-methyl-D-erythritol 4-phosphate cytidylyltransferase [Tepidisphaeraceae bacterium]|nr:2-C-methyl-D-erythritol 4-phosphate cytidylyltransferase [Tepidisphaeraceae bacterium]